MQGQNPPGSGLAPSSQSGRPEKSFPIVLVNDSGQPASEVLLAWSATKTELKPSGRLRLETAGATREVRADWWAAGRTLLLRFPDSSAFQMGRRMTVSVPYVGEPPVLKHIAWLPMDGAAVATQPSTRSYPRATAAQVDPPISEVFRWRTRLVRASDVHTDAREFFLRFDTRTNAALLAAPDYPEVYELVFGSTDPLSSEGRDDLRMAIARFGPYLSWRSVRRASLKRAGDPFAPDRSSSDDARAEGDAKLIEDHLWRVFAPLRVSDSELNQDLLEKYFYLFVSGELGLGEAHGTDRFMKQGLPNSVYFLSFPEMVSFFVERDTNGRGAAWRPALRPFVMAAEAFVDLYWRRKGRNRDSYATGALRGARFSREAWGLLRASYIPKSFDAIEGTFGSLCAVALRDEAVRYIP